MMQGFTALYAGVCALCPSPIKPGQLVHYGPTDELEHVRCPETADDAAMRHPECPRCTSRHPGEC